MITRVWHGWTTPANAPKFEALLKEEIFVGIARREIPGYHGISLLKRPVGHEVEFFYYIFLIKTIEASCRTRVEFVTVMWFSDLDAVRLFAGADYETAVVAPKARSLLSRFDGRSANYETVCPPPGFQTGK